MDGIETQRVHVKFVEPLQSIVNEIAADVIAFRTFEIQGVAPCGFVVAGEVRREIRGVIAFGAEVVVDDIKDDSDAGAVAGVYETLERFAAAVRILHGEGIDAVIAPVSLARKLRDRHRFNRRDAKILERFKARDDGVEGALGSEGADVKLIDNILRERQATPGLILPIE